jgi:hypothetical protein
MKRTRCATVAMLVITFAVAGMTGGPSARAKNPVATQPATVNPEYVFALTAANGFLDRWSHRDWPAGIKLLSPRLLASRDRDDLEMEICGPSNPHHQTFEIGAGHKARDGRYVVPVTLYSHYSYTTDPIQPMATEITLIRDTADAEKWLVDEMPESAWRRIQKKANP